MTVLLRTDGIKKAYGGVQALDGATISVEEGTVAGLIGPNGSGKTTLFNVITGYERPDEGQVYFGDKPITNQAPDKVFAAGIGRTFQLTRIFPRLTVIENMLIAAQGKDRPRGVTSWFGKDAWTHHRKHAMDLLEFVGIERHANVLSGSLSYGQRKLLEMAYVLVADPQVILLDEPAGGVNPTLINHIADRIRQLNSAGQDVPDRRAQHGVRDGAVRHHHRARVRRGRGERAAGHHQDGQARARRLPGRGPGGGRQ